MIPIFYYGIVTPSKRPGDEIIPALQKFIRRGEMELAVRAAYELYLTGEELIAYLWRRLLVISTEDVGLGEPMAPVVVDALHHSSRELSRDSSDYQLLFVYAVRYLCACRKERGSNALTGVVKRRIRRGDPFLLPGYVYDIHTLTDQERGRSIDHFLTGVAYVRSGVWATTEELEETEHWERELVALTGKEEAQQDRTQERKNPMTNRALVISIDALVTADIPALKQLPNLGRVTEHASWITDIECIYPTLTYPCHATIATGYWPDWAGINNDEIPDFFAKGRTDWYWWWEAIQVPTVVDFARQAGLTVSTVTWPVMCASEAEYNIGEIWAPREEDDPTSWFTRANSPAMEEIFEANKHILRWIKTPQMDEFAARCTANIVRVCHPDLMLLHLSYVDHQRRRLGVHGDLEHAFRFADGQMGLVLDALEETGSVENTNVMLLGDHDRLYCDEMFHLSALFYRLDWLQTAESGSLVDYQVYAANCSLSAHTYLRPKVSRETVYCVLLEQ